MTNGNVETRTRSGVSDGTDNTARKHAEEALLRASALQRAIFNSANFSSIATDAKGVIQIFNVGAERMLGYTAAEVVNKITPADISDPQELTARAKALSVELATRSPRHLATTFCCGPQESNLHRHKPISSRDRQYFLKGVLPSEPNIMAKRQS